MLWDVTSRKITKCRYKLYYDKRNSKHKMQEIFEKQNDLWRDSKNLFIEDVIRKKKIFDANPNDIYGKYELLKN